MATRIKIITLEEDKKSNRYVLYSVFKKYESEYHLLILEKIYEKLNGYIIDEGEIKKFLNVYEILGDQYFKINSERILNEAFQSAKIPASK